MELNETEINEIIFKISKTDNIGNLMDRIINKARFGMYWFGWDKDTTARYIYISLGQVISKSPKFFYSIENKYLTEDRLTPSEMKSINEKEASFDVTCQVTAKMLVKMLKEVGIEAELVKTIASNTYEKENETYDVYHYFAVFTGNNNQKYFMTLNADLVNIKFGFPTEHFGTEVSYYIKNIKTKEYILDANGRKIPYYQGSPIQNSTIPKDRLKQMDMQIGYITSYGNGKYDYVKDLSNIHKRDADKKHIERLIEEDNYNFYKNLEDFFKKINKDKINELTEEELKELELYIYSKTISVIAKTLETNIDNINDYFIKLLREKKLDDLNIKLIDYIKKVINKKNPNPKDLYNNVYIMASSMINLLKSIELLRNSKNEEELRNNSSRYRNSLTNLLKSYVDQSKLRRNQLDEKHKEYTNNYLYNKLKNIFINDFECRETIETGYIPPFCNYGLLEQQNFIKEYIKKILQRELVGEDKFFKRVLFSSVLLDESLDNYSFIIGIYNEDKLDSHTYFFIYNPKTNIITDDISALDIIMNYKVLSNTVNRKLEEIESYGRER